MQAWNVKFDMAARAIFVSAAEQPNYNSLRLLDLSVDI
jgi:hypothetical protein